MTQLQLSPQDATRAAKTRMITADAIANTYGKGVPISSQVLFEPMFSPSAPDLRIARWECGIGGERAAQVSARSSRRAVSAVANPRSNVNK